MVISFCGCGEESKPVKPDDRITVTDIDGNVYQAVTIGTQVWMAENLKVTHYRNGEPIDQVADDSLWSVATTGAYCNYDNDEENVGTYGRLYNWLAVTDGRNIAPEGWHVPSDAEWQILDDYLGGNAVAGGKMKEADTSHWFPPNEGATNESGFTALPGGRRGETGMYGGMGGNAGFASVTEYRDWGFRNRTLHSHDAGSHRFVGIKQQGLSVRCVRD